MSEETNTSEQQVDEVDLGDFEKDFFEVKETKQEETTEEAPEEETEETKEEVTQETEDEDTLATEDEEEVEEEDQEEEETSEEEESEPEEKPKPKTRAQERIEELNAKFREAERRAELAEARLAEREKLAEKKEPENTDTSEEEVVLDAGPSEDDLDENGEPKYPLGQFDPKFMKDTIQHALEQDRKAREEEAKQTEAQKAAQAEAEALSASWNEKLDPAKERYPDFEEKGQELIDSFSDLDQDYGEYLTTVLMSMDKGPDVLYYLSNNPEEARSIVNSGAQKATIALGRIEAGFLGEETETKPVKQKVSKAPTPPPKVKGTSATKMSIEATSADVNLDALAKELAKGG